MSSRPWDLATDTRWCPSRTKYRSPTWNSDTGGIASPRRCAAAIRSQRERIQLSNPWDFGWLAEMVEAWGFRMMQQRGAFADRREVAARWFEDEYVPVSEMLAQGGLTERDETEAEAYMRLAGQRYLLLRTHEWSDEVVNRLRRGSDKKRRRLPRRRRRPRY